LAQHPDVQLRARRTLSAHSASSAGSALGSDTTSAPRLTASRMFAPQQEANTFRPAWSVAAERRSAQLGQAPRKRARATAAPQASRPPQRQSHVTHVNKCIGRSMGARLSVE